MTTAAPPTPRVAFLGPAGTFSEEAVLTQRDLVGADLVACPAFADILALAAAGQVDLGFVPIENSIEGSVNEVLDGLIFESDVLIQREVEIGIRLNLVGPPGMGMADVRRVLAQPVAAAQCRLWMAKHLPGVEVEGAASNADSARRVAEGRAGGAPLEPEGTAALSTALAAELHGLGVLAADVEDRPENTTRFVAVARGGIPAPTGHDKTSLVCFQHADRPGSLYGILGQFSARNLNLTRLESRPTKRGMGDYCFVIDLEGHVDDEVVADCLRDLHAQLAGVKFLGSYPAAGEHGPAIRRDAEAKWRAADAWITALRSQIRGAGGR